MLWKVLLGLFTVFSHSSSPGLSPETEYIPTESGPQTAEEAEIARAALHDNNLYGGDIVLPDGWNETDASIAGIRDIKFRWFEGLDKAIVPFVIDQSSYGIRNIIYQAIEQYHRHTCVRFVPRTNQTDYIRIFSGNGCWSAVGRSGGRQDLSLGKGCGYIGLVIHQLGHAIGLFHEHQRSDRDNYVTIYRQNAIPSQLHNFAKMDKSKELIFTPYE
ncbi:high choriolytic enzyme 2 [Trichonephila inaurata madagascariensis]|uniref:Metalloendopeptidase n=1 Tax=Trichonephila inaurata madagascariensis TaxID=2747483 RepID=A0A8X6YB57_9ARAC|nr:high choriolytic enzyme 2 [Trichonephila inaurata madagascariensis]